MGDIVVEPVPSAIEAIDDAVPDHGAGFPLAHGAFDLAPAGVELLPALPRAVGESVPAFAADDPRRAGVFVLGRGASAVGVDAGDAVSHSEPPPISLSQLG